MPPSIEDDSDPDNHWFFNPSDDDGFHESDDEIVFTGEAHNTPPRQPILQNLADFDQRLGLYRARMAELFRGRQISPLPELFHQPQNRAVGFGAVLRAGNRAMQVTNRPQPIVNAQRLRDVYAQGPRSWGVYDADPLGTSSNPLPGVIFVPETTRGEGFTVQFDAADEPPGPIEIDDLGEVVPPQPNVLICANCPNPLLLSAAYRSPEDTVWALRCGHMIDQRCLQELGYPKDVDPATALADAEALMAGPGKKKRKRTPARKRRSHIWHCPVAACGTPHTSVEGPAPLYKWGQDEKQGALQLYA